MCDFVCGAMSHDKLLLHWSVIHYLMTVEWHYGCGLAVLKVLLLLICCLLLLPLWESVIVLCFVVCYFMSILVLQSS